MIRDSETENTFKYHVQNGNLTSIKRMVTTCGLTETKGTQNSWSLTQMSARDVARLAKCIGDGRAAGPKWTGWLERDAQRARPGAVRADRGAAGGRAEDDRDQERLAGPRRRSVAHRVHGRRRRVDDRDHGALPELAGEGLRDEDVPEVTKQLLTQPPD